ncbi:uncharacterized protein LOC126761619 isoform X1 [Bactrocera neohumeralis]|uniref:uncharacterized protein LOC120776855 isoform X1 n=2 Tax=Bactrocera tryoni TaxID=59916 RepID=UPI001A99AF0F|nr:uncharacterized protein LOC120776855 isoform X1 [Bactrocera tryoni]XP_050333902.1 uncharacterized protein LOC126761619 isoform X1 [Bactrocera neohumeralis]
MIKMHSVLLCLCLFTISCSAQFYFHQPVPLPYQQHQYLQYTTSPPDFKPISEPNQEGPPHPSVVANAERESLLPPELSKSRRFYSNPRIAAALAKESLLTPKEMAVIDREAEKIDRNQIYKIFHNAGWA